MFFSVQDSAVSRFLEKYRGFTAKSFKLSIPGGNVMFVSYIGSVIVVVAGLRVAVILLYLCSRVSDVENPAQSVCVSISTALRNVPFRSFRVSCGVFHVWLKASSC